MKKEAKLCSLHGNEGAVDNRTVKISELHDFEGHPFKVEKDLELFALTKSIEDNGVLVPLLVRPHASKKGYEIIAGHRRKEASIWAGLDSVPVMVVEMDDAEAIIAMVDSNLQRENIKPSEKAFAYKMKLEAMKHQGKTLDTLSQLGTKLKKEVGENGKPILRSDEILAKQVGESRNQIARYIRLTNLIPKILGMVDDGKIALSVAVELSYLTENEQYELHAVMDLEQCTPSLSQANRIKRLSQKGELDMDAMYEVLEEEKPNQREHIKIRADTLDKYFPTNYTPRQKTELIEKLLQEWHNREVIKSMKGGGRHGNTK